MAVPITLVNTATDTFELWVNKTNEIANAISNVTVTANSTNSGSLTTGNAFVNGIFGTSTLATNTLRGGNVAISGNLTISTNAIFTGTYANLIGHNINSTTITVGNLVIGLNESTIGNSTINVVTNSSSISISGSNVVVLNNRMEIANNGSIIGARKTLNLIGNGATLAVTDDEANNRIDVIINVANGATVGGTNTTIQFNDTSTSNGSSGFIFDKTTNVVSISNTLNVANVYLTSIIMNTGLSKTANAAISEIDSFTLLDWRSGEYVFSIKNETANGFQAEKILVLNYGGNAIFTSYGVLYSNGLIGTFSANANVTHIRMYFNPGASNTSIKAHKTLISI